MGSKKELSYILKSYNGERGELVPLLQQVQESFGYLPRKILIELARFLEIPESSIYGVATFYNQFRFTPIGRHPVKVCLGTACHMQGGGLVLESVERELEIKVGGLTPDGEFSLERVACVGCCVMAPVTLINSKVYPKMTPLKVEEILAGFKEKPQSSDR